ncbi:hypothetical protein Taro_009265 [Colocasia esculenta]|uniref:Uncharacterized protein n=1 Tax=Colocasia esculenta TaxID=4460 RepID=A0A843U5X4_COLES|nr:hypothetical protein [Colocasia esculenta]
MDEAPTEGEQIASVSQVSTSVAEGHIEMEEAPSQVEPIRSESQMSESVAEGHSEDIVLEEAPTLGEQENVVKSAPIQGEQELGTEEAPSQGEPIENAPVNKGPATGHGEFEEPVTQKSKSKRVVHRRQRKSHRKDRWTFFFYYSEQTSRCSSATRASCSRVRAIWAISHKTSWGPFILKEIRIAKNFQLYSDFCYLNKLPEVQFYQFHSAIVMLRSEHPINLPLQVDFAHLQVDSPVLLPKLHSLVFDSDAGSHAFDMFAKQMGRMSAKQGRMPSFLRFIFREYHSGRISSQVLGPLISECERLSPSAWETLYKESHLQLQAINSSLFRQNKPILSAEAFLDLNSVNPVQEIYVQWAARYTAFYALKKDLLDQKIFYPISLDRFLHRASFGKSTYFRFILDKDQYGAFLEQQRQLYIQRTLPAMGSSFSVAPGVFHQLFEDMEIKAWAVISQHASLLSPLYYIAPN